jgi:signal transduction histidine kinase
MLLDTQTTIFMICFVYLMLHGCIWLALIEYKNFQVKLWCMSGLISGVGVVLMSLRGVVPEFAFFVIAQLLMVVGNLGRMMALRIYLRPSPLRPSLLKYSVANAMYMALFFYLIYVQQAEWEALMLFNGFYTVLCFDYFRIGRKLNQRRDSLGAKLLMAAGLSFTLSLGIRTLGVWLMGDVHDIYAPSWDQAVMIVGQFTAITLSNIAFLRIFLEIAERKKLAIVHDLAVTNERAELMRQTSVDLRQLLQEREEIIRQLALFNKTAGMGALVASLAHELNQPLTAIQLNAELIDATMSHGEGFDDAVAQSAMRDLIKDNQRAANIIKTLRNMFGSGRKSVSAFDLNELVGDVLLLCKPKLDQQRIALKLSLHPSALPLAGDKSQLQQVLLNLITNAMQALEQINDKQKRITITTRLEADKALLTVADNGTGITPDIASSMFELLRTNKEDGMGIGLWLSQTIVAAHHGLISFETQLGEGTSFCVSLPASTQEMVF